MFVQITEDIKNKIIPLVRFNMGSNLHGDSIKDKSDDDYLYLYLDENYTISPYNFGLQYKDVENNCDHNYVEIRLFVSELLKGESPAYFEVLFDENAIYKDYDVSKLISVLKNAYIKGKNSFNLIKSYSGYMKKDLKRFESIGVDCYEKRRYATHIIRQHNTIQYLIGNISINRFTSDNPESRKIKNGEVECPNYAYLQQMVDDINNIRLRMTNNKETIATIEQSYYKMVFDYLSVVVFRSKQTNLSCLVFNELKWNVLENGLNFQYI